MSDFDIDYRAFIEEQFLVLNKKQEPVPFVLNPVQDKYHNILVERYPGLEGVREITLKARQQGMCLRPTSKVLMSDFKWKEVQNVKPGDKIVGVSEDHGTRGVGRSLRESVVEVVAEVCKPEYRIELEDGREIYATPEHRFLCKRSRTSPPTWLEVSKMKVGSQLRRLCDPVWESTKEDYWFGGIIDGEGTIRKKTRAGVELSVSQVSGPVWDRIIKYVEDNEFKYRVEWDTRKGGETSKFGNKPVGRVVIGNIPDIFKIIGKCQPTKYKETDVWQGKELPGKRAGQSWLKIVSIEKVSNRSRMIDLQTSSKTFIAEGVVSHNSSYILALFTVDFLVKPHSRSLCISHSQDSTEALFRKVKFYIQSFCERNGIDPKILLSTDNREMLVNKTNDAQFRIMTAGSKVGARGDTVTNILFSETAFYPDVEKISAREMVEGTIQQVEQDHGMIFLESTANGFGNYYQEMWEMATKGESIYHATFFGWQEFYTKEWIEKKRKSFLDEKMFNQEFPATPEDAFISTGDQFFNADVLQEYVDSIIKKPIKTGELAADGEFI